eukprot:scaffold203029_cov43-Tisochrysis_lutea.AAC.1
MRVGGSFPTAGDVVGGAQWLWLWLVTSIDDVQTKRKGGGHGKWEIDGAMERGPRAPPPPGGTETDGGRSTDKARRETGHRRKNHRCRRGATPDWRTRSESHRARPWVVPCTLGRAGAVRNT